MKGLGQQILILAIQGFAFSCAGSAGVFKSGCDAVSFFCRLSSRLQLLQAD